MSEDAPGFSARSSRSAPDALAEVTGLNGSFVFPERLLQQIWLRGDFHSRGLRLRDGRPVQIVRRGRWNRLAGPDFRDAEIRVGEGAEAVVLRGDIEAHLQARDWEQHGHAADPAYDRVVLHVVLFPSVNAWTQGAGGRRIPILELLPLLERDLEAYAEEAAIETLAGRPFSQLRAALAALPAESLAAEVARHASRRWARKVALARLRVERVGWEAACHESALEVLGYRPNRAPMLAVAELWPLAAWREGLVSVEAAWAAGEPDWARGGTRPANQPRARLAQYAGWVAARPDWPAVLAESGPGLAEAFLVAASASPDSLRARRRGAGLTRRRKRLAEAVTGGFLGGSRLDTMICDAWLPLLATRDGADFYGQAWRDWIPGDAPAELLRLAREFGVGGSGAGGALGQGELQGLLGWMAEVRIRSGRGT